MFTPPPLWLNSNHIWFKFEAIVRNIILFRRRIFVESNSIELGLVHTYPDDYYINILYYYIIPFYPKKVSSDRNSIHKYLDRLPILFTRSQIRFLFGQTSCGQALHLHLSFPILPGQAVHTCLGSENCSSDRFVLHILQIEKGKLSG